MGGGLITSYNNTNQNATTNNQPHGPMHSWHRGGDFYNDDYDNDVNDKDNNGEDNHNNDDSDKNDDDDLAF